MKKFILIALILIPATLGATTEETRGGNLSAKIEPTNPKPNETVTVTLSSYQLDLDRSSVSWIINGQSVQSGPGLKTYTGQVGSIGTSQVWRIIAQQGSTKIEKIITFRPAEVDLLWQADTYVPSTYLGKALATSESPVTVVAIPNLITSTGKKYPAAELIYRWEKDFNFIKNQSGLGREAFTFTSDKLFGSNQVKVTVSTPDNTITAEETITIPIRTPFLALYEYRALTGPNYRNQLGQEINIGSGLFSIIVEPFFFTNEAIEKNNFELEWLIDNKPLTLKNPQNRRVTFEGGQTKGSVNLNLTGTNRQNTLQTAAYTGIIKVSNNESIF